ncbi:MAG: hypothetical protein F2534_01735 [Actinobacteria bacterium]|nr:hypothetical protein [Actinomycetota bacterium]
MRPEAGRPMVDACLQGTASVDEGIAHCSEIDHERSTPGEQPIPSGQLDLQTIVRGRHLERHGAHDRCGWIGVRTDSHLEDPGDIELPLDQHPGARLTAMASDDLLIERLLRVIDEGRRTATYKLALLLGIIDTAATMPNETELPTRAIAERVLELYYPQTRSYVDRNGVTFMPRQISMKSSTVLAAVERLRVTGDAMRCRSIDEVARRAQRDYERTLDVVEDTFVRYPIPLLQTIGTTPIPFLYAVDWSEGTTVASLRRSNGDRIRLLDGVADRLVVLGPMLRPLIEHHWTQDVARWTRITTEDEQLRSHLFGPERAAFPKVLAGGLLELQAGSCFYCEARLDKRVEVDHFLPWSRWPNDAIENLVLADQCNSAKSDHLAATAHLQRWRQRLELHQLDLAEIAGEARWTSSLDRSRALVQTTYQHLASGTPLWLRGHDFEFASGPSWD